MTFCLKWVLSWNLKDHKICTSYFPFAKTSCRTLRESVLQLLVKSVKNALKSNEGKISSSITTVRAISVLIKLFHSLGGIRPAIIRVSAAAQLILFSTEPSTISFDHLCFKCRVTLNC